MSRTCTVCKHQDREGVERALLARESYRDIEGRFGTSRSALQRHRQEHLMDALRQAHGAQEIARADSLLEEGQRAEQRNRGLYALTLELVMREKDRNPKFALDAIRTLSGLDGQYRQWLEFRGALAGMEPGNPAELAHFFTAIAECEPPEADKSR